MLNIIVKIVGSLICGFTILEISEVIFNNKDNILKIKIITLIMIGAITYFLYDVIYQTESNILRVILLIIIFKCCFKETMYKTIVGTIMTIVALTTVDLLSSIIFSLFITVEETRGVWYYLLLCNLTVCIISIILIHNPFINKKLSKILSNLNERSKLSSVVLLGMYLVIMLYILYNISLNYNWSAKYFINIIIEVGCLVTAIIFIRDRAEYNRLFDKYEGLFECLNEFENNIDDILLVNHEYKNQLAIIKGYIQDNKKKEAQEYLNEIIKEINIEDKDILSELKHIPKGGLKGLFYYKIITAKNKNTNLVLDISSNSTKALKKLTREKNKIISRVLGVYIDNAIEGASISKKKLINIEIYVMNKEINFVITNSIKKTKIDINKVSKKGYTTKGKGHGQGLYLINKIINRNNYLRSETKIIKDYFIQKLIVIIK